MAEIAVLGPVAVMGGGAPVALRSHLQRLLLAVLVARHGRVVTADELVEALWGDALPAQPISALQSQVFRLRRQLGPAGAWLRTHDVGYALACDRDQLDAARFEDLVAHARSLPDGPEAVLGLLDAALGLWRGRAYLEVAEHEAVRADATRLEELRAEAAEDRAELLLAIGRSAEAAQAMEDLARHHAFRERPVGLWMRALAADGRHVDALAVFEQFRRRLGEELGLDPSPGLRALEGEILRHEGPPPPTIGLPGNSFVGRETDIAEIAALLDGVRMVTLIGPGGVGKTRLALHAAAGIAERYPDGVWLCELAKVTQPDAVGGAVASLLRVGMRGERTAGQRVVEFLQAKRMLLVLDNCEHVVEGVGELVGAILAHAAAVDLLATSRHRLGVEGEHLFTVRPLPTSDTDEPGGPALALFADRVAAVRPGLVLARDNVAAVGELCRRLDGLPLAIELAAARSVSRSTAEILAEVVERMDELADQRRAVHRHRSIDAVVGWSYEHLGPGEQAVFRRLSVFTGGWTAESAAAVLDTGDGEVVDALGALAEHSLVNVEDVEGVTRFAMLEPVRQYAQARLTAEGIVDEMRARTAVWMVRWIETADAGLRGADEQRWATAIGVELANLRAAHRWCLEGGHDGAVRIAGALFWCASWYGPAEVFSWADQTVERFADTHPYLTGALATAALGAWRGGDPVRARTLAQRGIALAPPGEPSQARFAWEALSSTELLEGNYERALACYDESIALAREIGDTCQEARERAARALVLGYLKRHESALLELESAADLLATNGNPTVRAFCDYVAGEIRVDDAPAEALPLLRRARDAARGIGNQYLAAIAGVSAVSCAARLGDPAEAIAGFGELIDHFHRTGSSAQQWTTIRSLVETLTRLGRNEPAAVLHGALTASRTAPPLVGTDVARMAEAVAALRSRLGDVRFAQLADDGTALDSSHAIAYAVKHARS